MTASFAPSVRSLSVFLLFILFAIRPAAANAPDEIRGLWVYGFGNDFHTPAKVTELIANARAANLNALFVQVRVRGDALYNSNYEPKRTNISPNFDPLADLIAKAHDTSGGRQRIEIHAWIVTYHAWNSAIPPPQPDHPYNLHPDWLMKTDTGNTLRTFDPAHPEVQQHIYNVAMDIVTHYAVDGINFDYIRYDSPNEGYNPVSIERFNKRHNRIGIPAPQDETWKQFRRDEITGLLRKIYLNAIAVRPEVKVSADTITWGNNGVRTLAQWPSSSAYSSVLQDWRGWMEEGILDLNVPMNYYREHISSPNYPQAYRNWSTFAKNHKYGRHLAIGPALYLNHLEGSIQQMRHTREPTELGNTAEGVVGYVYHELSLREPDQNIFPVSFSEFRKAVTEPTAYDPDSPPMFAQKANVPEMPWKTNPTTGHIMGYVNDSETNEPLDGALVQLSGPVQRTIQTDPTGFYGFVDLPPGDYQVNPVWQGNANNPIPVAASVGQVTRKDLLFFPSPPTEGTLSGFVRNAASDQPVAGAVVHVTGPTAANTVTAVDGFYKIHNLAPGNYIVSATWNQSPANHAPDTMISIAAGKTTEQNLHFSVAGLGGTPGPEFILDNLDDSVTFTGPDWRQGSFSTGYENGYNFAHNPSHAEYSGLHTATFSPTLPQAGAYRIDTWYPAGTNRAPDANYTIAGGESSFTVSVDQTVDGSQWVTIVDAVFLDPENEPFVRIDNTGSNAVTMADAVRWVYLEPIERQFSVTVNVTGEGRIENFPGSGNVLHGTVLELEAIGQNGFVFSHWTGKNAWGETNPLSLPVGADLELEAVFVSPWLDWIAANFTEEQRADSAFSGFDADPYNHGISNLLKFAFGLDPHSLDRSFLPVTNQSGDELLFTFRRKTADSGILYIVEQSADLVNWSSDSGQITEISTIPNDDGTETVTYRVPIENEARRFLKLRISFN